MMSNCYENNSLHSLTLPHDSLEQPTQLSKTGNTTA